MTPPLDALHKWPNVPFIYRYLSLTQEGKWHLHSPEQANTPCPDQQISNQGLIRFIENAYDCDEKGAWFFQNGPQRVYVLLHETPWILHMQHDRLFTHTQLAIQSVLAWYMDEKGKLYAHTEKGLGLIQGRDVATLMEKLNIDEKPWENRYTFLTQDYPLDKTISPNIPRLKHPHYPDAPLFFFESQHKEKIGRFIADPQA